MDEARFESVWQAHSRAIMRYCAFATGSYDDAEDLTAEVFTRYFGKGGRVNPDKVEAWLFAVARNLCASHHRSRGRSAGLMTRLAGLRESRETEDRSAVPFAEAWRNPEVWAHVRGLDERSRLAIYLRVGEDRPFAEVAQIMGVSPSAAKMTYYRALEHVRDSIAAEEAETVFSTTYVEDGPGAVAPAGGVGNAE